MLFNLLKEKAARVIQIEIILADDINNFNNNGINFQELINLGLV